MPSLRTRFLLALCLQCLCLNLPRCAIAAQGSEQASPVLVLKGGILIDGTGRNPVRAAVIIVRGNRIISAGTAGSSFALYAGAIVLDTSGKFILPGLIDSHFHYADWMPGKLLLAFGQTGC